MKWVCVELLNKLKVWLYEWYKERNRKGFLEEEETSKRWGTLKEQMRRPGSMRSTRRPCIVKLSKNLRGSPLIMDAFLSSSPPPFSKYFLTASNSISLSLWFCLFLQSVPSPIPIPIPIPNWTFSVSLGEENALIYYMQVLRLIGLSCSNTI